MTWQGTKTDWGTDDGVDNNDFNRIEGNILDNHERLDEHDSTLSSHNSRISSNDSDISSINSTLSNHDSRLDNIKWASGRYVGDNRDRRFIPVGFTPDIVLLNRGDYDYGDISFEGSSVTTICTTNYSTDSLNIVSNGFNTRRSTANAPKNYYVWIAIKL